MFYRYERAICSYLARLTGDPAHAQELAQETFIRAYLALARGERWDNPRAWLYRTASRLAIDDHRRHKLLQWLPLSDAERDPAPGSEAVTTDRMDVQAALNRLPPQYRIPLVLYVYEGCTVAEVATALGLSESAVKMRLSRARDVPPGLRGGWMNEHRLVHCLLALRPADWSDAERALVERHLTACADCAATARTYARQDRLICGAPRVGLTPAQRGQLFSRIPRERRRHEMRTRLSIALGVTATIATIAAVVISAHILLPQSSRPAPDTPVSIPLATISEVTATRALFAGEIRLVEISVIWLSDGPSGTPFYSQDTPPSPIPLAPAGLIVPSDMFFTFRWEVRSPPSSDWNVFVHMENEAGEVVRQSDVNVDWPAQPCTAECVATTDLHWHFDADFPPGLHIIKVGLYEPLTGARAPVTMAPETDSSALTLMRVRVIPYGTPQ